MISDINIALNDLTKDDRKDECIKHALNVRSAWALSNFHKFFQLYLNAPKMAGYLMDKFVGRVRKSALKAAIKAYVFNTWFIAELNILPYCDYINIFSLSEYSNSWLDTGFNDDKSLFFFPAGVLLSDLEYSSFFFRVLGLFHC